MAALRVRLLQLDLVWENVPANLGLVEAALPEPGTTDLVVLPEMYTTGFTMNTRAFASSSYDAGEVGTRYLKAASAKTGAAFCGSSPTALPGGAAANRMVFVDDSGAVRAHYDKRHLFAMSGEHDAYTPGGIEPRVVSYRGWKLLLQVCYDLRFPVFSRNTDGYHVALYVASWPSPRREHWLALLRARAIENQCYVLGVNRVGTDGNGLHYAGDTVAFGPLGEELGRLGGAPGVLDVELHRGEVGEVRTRLPFWREADAYRILGR